MMPKKYDEGSATIGISVDKSIKKAFDRKSRRKRNCALRQAIIQINNTLEDE